MKIDKIQDALRSLTTAGVSAVRFHSDEVSTIQVLPEGTALFCGEDACLAILWPNGDLFIFDADDPRDDFEMERADHIQEKGFASSETMTSEQEAAWEMVRSMFKPGN